MTTKLLALTLIGIAITALFLIYSPHSTSLFVGTHTMYNFSTNPTTGVINVTTANGQTEYCKLCHYHIWEELYSNPSSPHYDLSCETCHRFNGTGIKFAVINSTGAHPGIQTHAAYVPSCLDCHGGNGVWVVNRFGKLVHAPPAKAFNVTQTVNNHNVTVISSIPYFAAHKAMVAYFEKKGDENLACLMCHTNISKHMVFKYQYDLSYTLYYYTFTNFTPNGTRYANITINPPSNFNGMHEFIPLNKINCSSCHENIYLGLINGTHAPIYNAWNTTNLWGNPRYHALATSVTTLNVSWINNSYCDECHNLYRYAINNPTANTTYNLYPAAIEINSTKVHCAEKVSCLTCHGNGTPYDPYTVIATYGWLPGGGGGSTLYIAIGHENMLNQTANYSRMYHGDVCMACHEAAVHAATSCKWCHEGFIGFDIQSEPSGQDTII